MKPERPSASEFRQWCRELRSLLPLKAPVRIRRRTMKDCGSIIISEHTNGKPAGINIYINSALDREAQADALGHEWAHALGYDRCRHPPDVHDALFGTIHAEVYRVWNKIS